MGEKEAAARKFRRCPQKLDRHLAAGAVIPVPHDRDDVARIQGVHHRDDAPQVAGGVDDFDAAGRTVEAEVFGAEIVGVGTHEQVDGFIPSFHGKHGTLPVADVCGEKDEAALAPDQRGDFVEALLVKP